MLVVIFLLFPLIFHYYFKVCYVTSIKFNDALENGSTETFQMIANRRKTLTLHTTGDLLQITFACIYLDWCRSLWTLSSFAREFLVVGIVLFPFLFVLYGFQSFQQIDCLDFVNLFAGLFLLWLLLLLLMLVLHPPLLLLMTRAKYSTKMHWPNVWWSMLVMCCT